MWSLLRRIRAAAAVLLLPGDRMPVTRHDLRAFEHEFRLWEQTMTDSLEKLNAWYARQAKRQKRELAAHTDPVPASKGLSNPADSRARKRELSRRLAAGGGVLPFPPSQAPPPPEEES